MKKSRFRFDKKERSGIFFLLAIIFFTQISYLWYKALMPVVRDVEDDQVLLALREQLDSLANIQERDTVYPFNPNYLSDYKGYIWGMSVTEIDRLHVYRSAGNFVNSAEDFARVTGVCDTVLQRMAPYFRFPDFPEKVASSKKISRKVISDTGKKYDLNRVGEQELKKVSGVGEKLSARIVKYRNLLGGFSVPEQLYEVYGLDSVVVERLLKYFEIVDPPEIRQVNINTASLNQLASVVYISKEDARAIITYHTRVDTIYSVGELRKIEGFSKEKIARIELYLTAR